MSSKPTDKARKHYNVEHWSDGYFHINEAGLLETQFTEQENVVVTELTSVVEQAQALGAKLPLLLRFKPILRHRVQCLKQAFEETLREQYCDACFLPVYPVKVNQQKSVVEEILALSDRGNGAAQETSRPGLEVGSKAELLLAITMGSKVLRQGGKGLTIICNGFKDQEYIRLALMARRCGLNTYIVIEKYRELEWILALVDELGVNPLLGIRVRLNTLGKSNWQNSGGEKSKFGVTAAELLKVIQRLSDHGLKPCLQLLHFHLGSQISHIGDIQSGLKEAARYYAELMKLDLPIQWLDIGGGLGVDYEGSRSRNYCSMNYSLPEYAHTVVHTVKEVCDRYGVKFPNLITEAGRAMTAHHAVLVTEVMGSEPVARRNTNDPLVLGPVTQRLNASLQKILMAEQFEMLELYHQVCSDYEEIQSTFVHGIIGLEEKATAESLYGDCCVELIQRLDNGSKARQEARRELLKKIPHKTLLNFSLFRSLPDVWGIDQIFPIMPLQNLQDELSVQSILQDITCDSDGRIDQYIEAENIEVTFSLAETNAQPNSLIGIFLVGAYQEILGDNHNLFGKTDAVTVDVTAEGEVILDAVVLGDSVQSVLADVNYEGQAIIEHLTALTNQLPEKEGLSYLRRFRECLASGTYLK